MRLHLIPPDKLAAAWRFIEPFARQIAGGHHDQASRRSAEDIATGITEGRELAWAVLDEAGSACALVLGGIVQFPRMKLLRIHSCVGVGRKAWLPLLAEIEAFAKAQGCEQVEVICRKGWARELPDYRLTHVVMVRAV
ncbi:hypothetical protein [Ferrovibrio sp.]|uniref:hypothetical protein n=1 Tax=Ferrovibrio sp. TaxID=1917215 RepID=UPI0035B1A40E